MPSAAEATFSCDPEVRFRRLDTVRRKLDVELKVERLDRRPDGGFWSVEGVGGAGVGVGARRVCCSLAGDCGGAAVVVEGVARVRGDLGPEVVLGRTGGKAAARRSLVASDWPSVLARV
jgi:hypothetical protein